MTSATDRLTTAERLAEVAQILAAGILRTRLRMLATREQVRLDLSLGRSVHAVGSGGGSRAG